MSIGWIIAMAAGAILLVWVILKAVKVVVPIVQTIQSELARVQADRPGEALAEVMTSPEETFELKYVVNSSSQHNLFLRYHLFATRIGSSGGRPVSNAGIAVRFTAKINGELSGTYVVGMGQSLPCEVDNVVNTTYDKALNVQGSAYAEEATIHLASFKPRPAGTELVVSGQILLNQNTQVSELRVFISPR